jgi:DNA-binding NarL/FixJ family response regulator
MDDEEGEIQIRLALLDAHGLFRASLSRFLAAQPGFEVVGECGSGAEAKDILQRAPVDILLLDFEVASERASEFMIEAREAGYQGQFLVVGGSVDARTAAVALRAGASGIFMKSEAPERLIHALRRVAEGEVWIDQKVVRMLADQLIDRLPEREPAEFLGDRERSVLLGILGGLTNKKIGDNIGISESGVKNIVQRLFAKANVKTRSQLVRVALEGSLGAVRERQPTH